MGTKLEALISVLTEQQEEQDILDKLVLDYFNKQYESEFVAGEEIYEVLDSRDKKDQLYDIAEGLYSDYKYELERMAQHGSKSSHLNVILDCLEEEECIKALIEELDFEEAMQKTLVGDTREYFVYVAD
jgi:hypothetical protein